MSITLNHSDFQCLQDQLVDLKTKNYELSEKTRRSQADFEAAKAKICSLQLKLEEQERDFQVTSTTLKREIETAYSLSGGNRCGGDVGDSGNPNKENDEDHKTKYKKLLHKAKELQQRYEKSVEVVQQMDNRIKALTVKASNLEEENAKLKVELDEKQKQSSSEVVNGIGERLETLAGDEVKVDLDAKDCSSQLNNLDAIAKERDTLKAEVEKLHEKVGQFNDKLENQAEERRIQERKGSQMVKELKRQLAIEKSRSETLQKRLENLLINDASTISVTMTNPELDSRCRLSASSSTNGNSNNSSNSRVNNHDSNSVSSWSLVAGKTKSSNPALNETLSICSIESEDRETVQQPKCDTRSESSLQPVSTSSTNASRQDLSTSPCSNSPMKMLAAGFPSQTSNEPFVSRRDSSSIYASGTNYSNSTTSGCMSIEEQAALIERLTCLQHDKWSLEEKLSYLEQANLAMTEELANKSDIIKNYFMDQALRSISHQDNSYHGGASGGTQGIGLNMGSNLRRGSLTSNVNQLLSEKPSLKKVVDFLKERSQVSSGESESISREATKKMQLMLEESLIKCLRLQENLDSITLQLNKLER